MEGSDNCSVNKYYCAFCKNREKIQFNVFVNVKNAFVAAFRWQICLFVTRNVVLFPLNE